MRRVRRRFSVSSSDQASSDDAGLSESDDDDDHDDDDDDKEDNDPEAVSDFEGASFCVNCLPVGSSCP